MLEVGWKKCSGVKVVWSELDGQRPGPISMLLTTLPLQSKLQITLEFILAGHIEFLHQEDVGIASEQT